MEDVPGDAVVVGQVEAFEFALDFFGEYVEKAEGLAGGVVDVHGAAHGTDGFDTDGQDLSEHRFGVSARGQLAGR